MLLNSCESRHVAIHRGWETACLLQGVYLLSVHASHDCGSYGAIWDAIGCNTGLSDGLRNLALCRGCLGDAGVSDLLSRGKGLLWMRLAIGLLPLQQGGMLLLHHLSGHCLLLFSKLSLTLGFQGAQLGWGLHVALTV